MRVDTPEGYAEEELKVEVLELTPPTISIIIPSKGLKVPQNTDYILSPDIQHDDLENFRIEWVRDGEIVGTEKAYTFHEKELGTYSITIRASNIDGETIRDFDVEVVETMPYSVRFPTPSYTQTSTDRYTFCRASCIFAAFAGIFRLSTVSMAGQWKNYGSRYRQGF